MSRSAINPAHFDELRDAGLPTYSRDQDHFARWNEETKVYELFCRDSPSGETIAEARPALAGMGSNVFMLRCEAHGRSVTFPRIGGPGSW